MGWPRRSWKMRPSLGLSLLLLLLLLLDATTHAFAFSSSSSSRLPLQQRRRHLALAATTAEPPPSTPDDDAAPLCLLHLAYDGGRYRGWADTDTTDAPTIDPPTAPPRPPKRLHPKRPPPPPKLQATLAQALSVIHSKAPPPSLGLQATVPTPPGVSARGAQLAFYCPPPPPGAVVEHRQRRGMRGQGAAGEASSGGSEGGDLRSDDDAAAAAAGVSHYYPFGGDWARAAHSLNRILPDDLRVLSVQPPPWEGFDPRRDVVKGEFGLTVVLGVGADPTRRHQGWVLDVELDNDDDDDSRAEEAYARQIEAALLDASSPDAAGFSVLAATVACARGPGVGAARARLLRVWVEVARPGEVDQRALVSWLGRVVRSSVGEGGDGGEGGEPPLGALVLEGLVFRGGGGKEWVVRDLYVGEGGGEPGATV